MTISWNTLKLFMTALILSSGLILHSCNTKYSDSGWKASGKRIGGKVIGDGRAFRPRGGWPKK